MKLVLTDFEMPKINGQELSREIRKREEEGFMSGTSKSKSKKLAIVGLTGHDQESIKQSGILSGMTKVIKKGGNFVVIRDIL